jgi:hypothetical protein
MLFSQHSTRTRVLAPFPQCCVLTYTLVLYESLFSSVSLPVLACHIDVMIEGRQTCEWQLGQLAVCQDSVWHEVCGWQNGFVAECDVPLVLGSAHEVCLPQLCVVVRQRSHPIVDTTCALLALSLLLLSGRRERRTHSLVNVDDMSVGCYVCVGGTVASWWHERQGRERKGRIDRAALDRSSTNFLSSDTCFSTMHAADKPRLASDMHRKTSYQTTPDACLQFSATQHDRC